MSVNDRILNAQLRGKIMSADEAAAKRLQRSGKPVFLAANKVDNEKIESEAAALWSLGLGQPHSISAMHGRGVADLLDSVLEVLPEVSETSGGTGGPRRVARGDQLCFRGLQ